MKPAIYHPILLYDDRCGLCSAAVRFVLRHDRRTVFRFAGLSSPEGRALLERHAVDPAIDSLVLIDGNRAEVRSRAMLAVLRRLGGGWHLLRGLAVIPRPIRDWMYDSIGRRRARWSARLGLDCRPPSAGERERFLDHHAP